MAATTTPDLRFAMLGAFEVSAARTAVDLGPHKQRLLLATLLCRANTIVSVDTLIDAVWDESAPRTARKNLQAYVSMLRKVVRERLEHTPYGYRMVVATDELDVSRFEALSAEGRRAARDGATRAAAEILGEALRLWRGPFLADMSHSTFLAEEALRLEDRRLRVYEDWADAAVALGDHLDVLEMIDEIADTHPERERLTAAKLTALIGCGRRQEALAHYEFIRQSLSRDLGLDPSQSLQQLFRTMLAGESVEPAVVRATPSVPIGRAVGAAVPPDTAEFTGRELEVGRVVSALVGAQPDPPGATVITGPVGTGKTSLAVHIAHLVGPQFPDGSLFVPMRDGQRRARTLPDVLSGICAAIGVDLGDCASPQAPAAWRAWLSRRRLLVVLDDARDAAVVRALLPGPGSGRMLVTSRYRLSGLDSVLRVDLGDLTHAEAVEMTAKIVGIATVLEDRDEVSSYIAHCGRSPMAVRIVAGRLRTLPRPAVRLGTAPLDQLFLGDLVIAERIREHCAEQPAREMQVLAALVATGRPPFDGDAVAQIVLDGDLGAAMSSLVEANLLRCPDTDEVLAHAERYEMPSLVYDFAAQWH